MGKTIAPSMLGGLSLLLSAVFVYASFAKAVDPHTMARTLAFIVEPIAGVPFHHLYIVVGLIASFEFVLGALLLFLHRRRSVYFVSGGVLAVFSAFVLYGYSVELPGGCGCGLPFGSKDVVSIADVSKTFAIMLVALSGAAIAHLSCSQS